MSVTRVDATRPVEATQTVATNQPRSSRATKHLAQFEDPGKPAEPEEPASTFKPYALSFRFDKELNRVVVKVLDKETGEVLRELPPESVIAALKQLRHALGRLVDEEA